MAVREDGPVRFWTDHDGSELLIGDSLDLMKRMASASVDAIVTSPEYADQRKYDANIDTNPYTYAEMFSPFLEQMLRVLKPTGSLMLNLGVILRNGEETPYADDTLRAARAMGWKLLHRTIWHKPNPLPLSHPDYLTIAHEWVFWLAPTTKVYRGYDADTRTAHSPHSIRRINDPYMRSKDERYAKRGKANALHPDGARPTTVRTVAVGSTRGIDHPAPMPLDLARYLVSLSCPPGGLVLDPFCGSGTTIIAARERGRRGIGIDRSNAYLSEAERRLNNFQPSLLAAPSVGAVSDTASGVAAASEEPPLSPEPEATEATDEQ
jgi:site-specific DNA-methyltransferase (adenine-specific)/site-specific DNA-methyltransferase (cytosine-N4-specific)